MKIDFVINSLAGGGAERVLVTIVNGLSKKHKVRIITFNPAVKTYYEIDEKVEIKNLHHGKIKNHLVRSLHNLHSFYRNKKNRPDVLISFIHLVNFISIIVGKLRNIKVIICEHTNHKTTSRTQIKFIRQYTYRFANALTVLTTFDLPYYMKYGAKTVVMPNPLILPKNVKPFSEREKNILLVGSLDRYKNKGFDSILKILEPILKSNPEWKLIIAGGGTNGHKALNILVKKLNIENQVSFTGFCKNIHTLMQNSQIFVLPSKFEGLPMGLMEALSNGMACIAYDCISGPRDLIENDKNGLLIENQNEKAMRHGLETLLNNKSIRENLALEAPSSVIQYGLDNILNQWESLIDNVIKK
ncbi:glycosyltransferase family 4 protein [Maribacter thermophilus]|uniref:glycosyltransferase family 4 protein n=1 Tax=Maribacter thermophilus TaxID=1197874 RepID=UPI000640D35C|nr:glycosyltransferase family 4 protein [Maribacter thermophilus]